ncbi:MAG: transcription antitermination factor NusB [Candidatus Kapabacteria bacterium]|nr:transcription antitermination factor NusB [Candidatus Kapabacteria bacterium]MDW8012270.1 transcription antitermination factor NusB [Bacteroidota bacterium]
MAREKVLQVFAAAVGAQVPWQTVFEHIFYRDFTVDVPTPDRPLLSVEEVQELEADTPIRWEEKDVEFARRLLQAAEQSLELGTSILRQVLQNWDVGRLVPIDRLILQLGIAEMLAFPQMPVPVVIDEAVELAKKYSTAHSGQFVNGVLEAAYYWMVQHGLRPPSPEMAAPITDRPFPSVEVPEEYSSIVGYTGSRQEQGAG